jgi:CDP-diacylglycerol--glycerol-3-phosphate 3-phosphatidyltransferase
MGAARGDSVAAGAGGEHGRNRVSRSATAPRGSLNGRVFPLNLPNALTLIRILLVPVLVVALTVESPGGSTIAAAVFAIAALTDGLDGYIARSRQAVTTFGKVMDPVADKLMIAAALIALVSLDRLAAWVAMVIIAREFAVSGLRIAAGQQGVVIPASALGKVKTIVQVAAVLALIAANDADAIWVQALVYAMVLVTVVSGADYFLNFRRKLEEASRARGGHIPDLGP